MRDQTLHATERFSEREELQSIDETPHGRNAAAKLEGHDGAETALLTQCNFMSRMGRQPWIQNTDDFIAGREKLRDALSSPLPVSGLTLQVIVGEVHPSTPFPNRAFRHGRARPGHPRGSHSGRSEVFLRLNDVDDRDKPGHDDATAVRSAAAP